MRTLEIRVMALAAGLAFSSAAVRVVRADAAYAVSIERCDDRNGNDKDVCVKEAKAAKVHSLADAKVRMETTQANHQANQISHQASLEAQETRTEARRESADEKRDADYAVAKEKCDAMSGDAKDLCVSDAKSRFGQR